MKNIDQLIYFNNRFSEVGVNTYLDLYLQAVARLSEQKEVKLLNQVRPLSNVIIESRGQSLTAYEIGELLQERDSFFNWALMVARLAYVVMEKIGPAEGLEVMRLFDCLDS